MEEKPEFLLQPGLNLKSQRYATRCIGIGGAPGPAPSMDADEVATPLAGATSTAITTTSSHVIFLRFTVVLLGSLGIGAHQKVDIGRRSPVSQLSLLTIPSK